MANKSISLNLPVEFIEVEKINPLITKTTVKVMYAGKNRNGSFISKETIQQMAASLPNIPIVGEWNEQLDDFKSHGEDLGHDGNGQVIMSKRTRPIGVVPSDTKIWWEKFLDNEQIQQDYLCCEAYIWTDRYPESQKIFKGGINNQSMELDPNTIKGTWAQLENQGPEYFIIEEALFTALCVLGQDVEPCFEGASISPLFYSLIQNEKETVNTEMALLRAELAEALSEHAKEKMTNFPQMGDNLAITMRNSKWQTFDPQFAEMIKNDYPEIWRLGGNIRGNSQYPKLSEALGQSSEDLSDNLKDAIKLREAWVARHFKDFRIAGTIAQIKWLAVGSKGQSYMKSLVREEIKRRKSRNELLEQNSSIDQSDFANKLEKLISVNDKLVKINNFSQKEEGESMSEIKEKFAGMVVEEGTPIVEIEDQTAEQEMDLKDLVTEIVKEVMASMNTQMAVQPQTVEVENPTIHEEVDLKDLITSIVKEIMDSMKTEMEANTTGKKEKVVEVPKDETTMMSTETPDFANEKQAYETKILELTEKLKAYENKEKSAMMEKFTMLDSIFLEEVKGSLDSYTIDQLEAKLSVEAVRSGLIFKSKNQEVTTYTVDYSNVESVPSWVIALEKKIK